MKKTLFIVSGGLEAVPGIQRAKDMGLHVVVSDLNPNAPGFKIADDCLLADTYSVEDTFAAALHYHKTVRPIDGVICIASDVPLTVATVSQKLGLPGISIETAKLSSDKLAMKECFLKKGISIPWFSTVSSSSHLHQITSEKNFPLILKPVDSRGARGVLKLTESIDLDWAYSHSASFSPSERVMVEEYLDGPQISTETIIINGLAFTPGFADRNYEFLDLFAPYIIENGGHQPSALSSDDQDAVCLLAEQAALALGISTGIAKGDMVLTKGGPKVIEIASRLSGGWFSTDQIPVATGVNLISAAIKLALGESILPEDLKPLYQKGVAIRYFFPPPGRVNIIRNADKFNAVPWVHKLGFFVKPGDMIEPVTNHTKRAGFVITTGETREQAIQRAVQAVNTIKIETVLANNSY
jgi:biotin carboxylase